MSAGKYHFHCSFSRSFLAMETNFTAMDNLNLERERKKQKTEREREKKTCFHGAVFMVLKHTSLHAGLSGTDVYFCSLISLMMC